MTFSGVAVAASVSRGWRYRQDDLRAAIIRLGPTASRPVTSWAANERASIDSLRQRLKATRTELARIRAENTGLRDQVSRSFGEQRARR